MVCANIKSKKDCGCIIYTDCSSETHIQYCKKHGGF